MSYYIETSSSKNIFSISSKLFSLLEDNNVINHISLSNYHLKDLNIETLEDNKPIPSSCVFLKAQFKKVYGTDSIYNMTLFDSYGKVKEITTFNHKRFLKKAFINYAKRKIYSTNYKLSSHTCENKTFESALSYHKQRVCTKITNSNFVSNEKDLKKEVYKFLLDKNKDAVIIPEFTIENRRADYISFDSKKISSIAVEIKSELDTFERLESQLETYSKLTNLVYLALDKKQYDKLKTKSISIPKHIGLLVFDNSKEIKLKEVKRAVHKNHKNNCLFFQYLSYQDINNSFNGFKYSSKLSKEQKDTYLRKCIGKDVLNRFSYAIVLNRHIKESDRRKELFYSGKIDKSVSSAKELKINRFDSSGKFSITLWDYIQDKDILYKYFVSEEKKLLEKLKDIINLADYIKNGSERLDNLVQYLKKASNTNYIPGLSNSFSFLKKINIKIDNQLLFLQYLVENKKNVKIISKSIKKECEIMLK